MSALMPCLSHGLNCTAALHQEVADIHAYHAWLKTSATNAVFATTVILHNLVSSTVAREYLRGGQPRYACVLDAARALPRELLGGGEFRPRLPQLAEPLPGVGRHRLVDCP
mmetsp:Transcript_92325/g.287780  ORF Transcript_92325/g.287780 Transcript_92325/m.287780 type:complete len:111 (+) Transcript_92325:516-848(+)